MQNPQTGESSFESLPSDSPLPEPFLGRLDETGLILDLDSWLGLNEAEPLSPKVTIAATSDSDVRCIDLTANLVSLPMETPETPSYSNSSFTDSLFSIGGSSSASIPSTTAKDELSELQWPSGISFSSLSSEMSPSFLLEKDLFYDLTSVDQENAIEWIQDQQLQEKIIDPPPMPPMEQKSTPAAKSKSKLKKVASKKKRLDVSATTLTSSLLTNIYIQKPQCQVMVLPIEIQQLQHLPGTSSKSTRTSSSSGRKRKKPCTGKTTREFYCHICQREKPFASNYSLRRHIKTLHGAVQRKNLCDICGKTFHELAHLKRHQQHHAGARPWPCPYRGCVKRFADRSNLQRHWLIIHNHATPPNFKKERTS